jgi:hypothetical protein
MIRPIDRQNATGKPGKTGEIGKFSPKYREKWPVFTPTALPRLREAAKTLGKIGGGDQHNRRTTIQNGILTNSATLR